MALEIEIEFSGMGYVVVNHGPGRAVAAPVFIAAVLGEEAYVMHLADHDNGKLRVHVVRRKGACGWNE